MKMILNRLCASRLTRQDCIIVLKYLFKVCYGVSRILIILVVKSVTFT